MGNCNRGPLLDKNTKNFVNEEEHISRQTIRSQNPCHLVTESAARPDILRWGFVNDVQKSLS